MMQFKSLKECITHFRDERYCWDYFEKMWWNGTPRCPHCGSEKVYRLSNYKQFKCGNKKGCDRKFTTLVGTVLENTKIPLSTWFAAIYLCTAHKKGVNSHQLARDLGLTQKTGWLMFHKIREMLTNGMGISLGHVVSVDEMYVKGKRGNKSKKIRKEIADGLREDKEMVVLGMVEIDGNVVYKHIKNAESETIKTAITTNHNR